MAPPLVTVVVLGSDVVDGLSLPAVRPLSAASAASQSPSVGRVPLARARRPGTDGATRGTRAERARRAGVPLVPRTRRPLLTARDFSSPLPLPPPPPPGLRTFSPPLPAVPPPSLLEAPLLATAWRGLASLSSSSSVSAASPARNSRSRASTTPRWVVPSRSLCPPPSTHSGGTPLRARRTSIRACAAGTVSSAVPCTTSTAASTARMPLTLSNASKGKLSRSGSATRSADATGERRMRPPTG